MAEHLLLRLEAPLMAFGGEIVDHRGVVSPFPGKAALTGLLANALGYDRSEGARHDRLQQRLIAGAIRVRDGEALRDFQTAKIDKKGTENFGWTTFGRVEGRTGGAGTYTSPHIRHRDWHADALVLVALRLTPADEAPDLDALAEALTRPERPLFLGRKPALPSNPLLTGRVAAATILAALQAAAHALHEAQADAPPWHAEWPVGEGQARGARVVSVCDERRWQAGLHGGLREVSQGLISRKETDA